MKKNTKKKSGFTLMETMVYIALFGILMSGAITSAWSLLEGGANNKNAMAVQEEGTFLSRKINWALTGATDVDVTGGGKILTVTRPDLSADSPLVIGVSGSILTITRGSSVAVSLNGDFFKITDVQFTNTPETGGVPSSIEAKFSVNSTPFIFKTYLRQ